MKTDIYKTINASREYIIDMICDLETGKGVISDDYIRPIAEEIVDDVADDIYCSAHPDEWNADDLRLAVGRILAERLGIYV